MHWPEQTRHGYRGCDRRRDFALSQPDLLSRMQIGRDGGERYGQIREFGLDEMLTKHLVQAFAFDEPAAQAEVRELEHAPAVEAERPGLQLIESADGKGCSDERADRATRDEIGLDSRFRERPQHSDVSPAARRARAESESDLGLARH